MVWFEDAPEVDRYMREGREWDGVRVYTDDGILLMALNRLIEYAIAQEAEAIKSGDRDTAKHYHRLAIEAANVRYDRGWAGE